MISAIIQARMSSARLPRKTMLRILDKPIIGYMIERVKKSRNINRIIVATSKDPVNDELCDYLKLCKIAVFRGSEEDVLDRFYQVALKYKLETIVRLTGDCPLIDPVVIDRVIKTYLNVGADYASNTCPPTFPDGLDVEVFRFEILEKTWEEARLPSDREHVTSYMHNLGNISRINVENKEDLSAERWAVDEQRDFQLIKEIICNLYPRNPDFSMNDILEFKQKNPLLFMVNSEIQRNEGYLRSLEEDRKGSCR